MTSSEVADVIVIGSGAAGLLAAIAARQAGLSAVVVEKAAVYGGTSATSGGSLWIPCTAHSESLGARLGLVDSLQAARDYLVAVSGAHADPVKIDAYLATGPEMIAFLERETEVRFQPREFPDYRSEAPGASRIRTIRAVDYDARKMGDLMRGLKGELPQTLFLGLAMRSAAEIRMFMSAARSFRSFRYVVARMSRHVVDLILHGHSRNMTGGRALIARLARTAANLDIPVLLSSPATGLVREPGGRVTAVLVETASGTRTLAARRAVVLASGGYPYDRDRRLLHHPGPAGREPPVAPLPETNTGDGARMAEAVGARFNGDIAQAAAWIPTSQLPGRRDQSGVWPHLVDRYKPGFIMVLADGRRFANEGANYHDLGAAMLRAFEERGSDRAWLIGDARAVKRWGIGFAKPFPIPHGHLERCGYLLKGRTLMDLAAKAGIDGAALEASVGRFNEFARAGEDRDFGRGMSAYDRFQGDDEHGPNPCLGPLDVGPFYAVRIHPGELGSFKGLTTNENAQVLDLSYSPIPGLYAVGNDQANAFGGAYPGAGGTLGPGMVFAWRAIRHIAETTSRESAETVAT